MLSSKLRSFNINDDSIRTIRSIVLSVREELVNEINNNIHDEHTKKQISKIIKLIDRDDVFDLSITEIEIHIQNLMTLIDFTLYFDEFVENE